MNAALSKITLYISAIVALFLLALSVSFLVMVLGANARTLKQKNALKRPSPHAKTSRASIEKILATASSLLANKFIRSFMNGTRSILVSLKLVKNVDADVYAKLARKLQVSKSAVYDAELSLSMVSSILMAAFLGISAHSLMNALAGFCVGLVCGAVLSNKFLMHWERIERRQYERDIPSMMSMIILAVQAGASFDTAFNAYATRFSGPLAQEASRAYSLYISQVQTRNDALDQMAHNIDIDIFYRFVSTVKRALYLGSPLALALEHQLADVRAFRSEKAKEEIAKKPIQILLPLGLFILPAMLILLLGPVLMEVMQGIRMG